MTHISTGEVSGTRRYGPSLYTRRALLDTDTHYRRMRDLGPLVWLSRHRMWSVTRFDDVRDALRARDILVPAAGPS